MNDAAVVALWRAHRHVIERLRDLEKEIAYYGRRLDRLDARIRARLKEEADAVRSR